MKLIFLPCPCGFDSCGYHVTADSKSDVVRLKDFLEGIARERLFAVLLKRPDPGYSFAIRAKGTVEDIAEYPCSEWRQKIRRAYRSGYRAVRFEVE